MAKAVIKVTDLKKIVHDVNRLYSDAGAHLIEATSDMKQIGILLVDAKKQVGHGKWAQWVDVNLPFGDRQASNYMRFSSLQEELGELKENRGLEKTIKLLSAGVPEDDVDAEVAKQKAADTALHLKEAEAAIKAFEKDQKKLVAQLEKLRTESGPDEDISPEIAKLKKQRDVLLEDIKGLKEMEKSLSRARDFFTRQLSAIPALDISPRVIKATKPAVVALLILVENWVAAMKEIFDV